jgi:hypothetical protein
MMYQNPALDAGGFARLDASDLLYPSDMLDTNEPCHWCVVEPCHNSDYRVVADNRYYRVCSTCWGRSAEYVALRREGETHNMALNRVTSAQ